MDLLVVGSANVDLTTAVERRPGPGETVLGGDLVTSPGGKGANQAVAAARLGARVALLARVGDDAHGRLVAASLAEAGVRTDALLTGAGPTGVALITVDCEGDNSIVVAPGANARLTPDDVHAAGPLFEAARVVSLQREIPPETVRAAAGAATAAGARVVLNPSPPGGVPPEVLAVCDPLVCNEHEARTLLADGPGDAAEPAQSPDAHEWATALLGRGPRSVVVTRGAAGAVLATPDGVRSVPSPQVTAVDTTGAGDAFTGALAWRLSVGDPLPDAVRHAVRVGAAATTRAGAQATGPLPDAPPAD
ncbi:ribokinase [Streptomyces sp. 549]|uniref:ribokinase n=1 Tax=Streptomyces sp. 549 TaxID=3049076 RepID=UPI0024C2E063|nr:ribokinase [Streptomyces sp. 549]MDK1471955.1 ribokinase [Streptomyces sp. 549]